MAIRREGIKFEGQGNLDKELNKLAKSADKLASSMDKVADEADKASKKSDGLGTKSAKLALGFNQIQQAASSVGGALADLVNQYAELDAANGRLQNSFLRAGGGARELAQAEMLATEMARRGQASRLESVNALRLLADASGDATKALSDYRLAVDIASQANIGIEQSTNLLAKARNGEVEEIKQLRGINKDLAADLGRVEDATLRAEFAVQLLTDSYEGAAEQNAGLIDKQNALKFSMEDLGASAGNLTSAIGTGAVGLVGSVGKLFGVLEEGQDPVTTLTKSFNGFADAIREATQPVLDLVEAGGALGAVFSGRTIFEVISDADTRRALAAQKRKEANKEAEKTAKDENEEAEKTVTVQQKITRELERQAEAKKAAVRKRPSRKPKSRDVDPSGFIGDFRDQADIDKERDAEIEELKKIDALEQELALRDAIAQLEIDGRSFDAERLAILNSELTDTEKKLELQRLMVAEKEAEVSATRSAAQAVTAQADAYGAVTTGLLELAGAGQAATIAQAALDGAKATYLAGIEFGLGNFVGAAALGVAAAQAFALAGSSAVSLAGGGGGGSRSASRSAGGQSASSTPVGQSARENRGFEGALTPGNAVYNVSFRSLTKPTPQEAREVAASLNLDARTRA